MTDKTTLSSFNSFPASDGHVWDKNLDSSLISFVF